MSRPLGFALLAVVIVVAAGLITLLEAAGDPPSPSKGGAADPLDLEPTAGGHEFPGVTAWLNGDPVASLNELEGKVVLIDFWTYTCVNCIRTIPFLRAWNDEYGDKGLVIIGIHSPEFTFEKSLDNVSAAVADLGIPWLVANDPERTSWDAFRARAWPTKILFGFDGRERKRVVGGVVVISVIVVLLGILGHLSESTQTWFGKEYYFDLMGMPHTLVEAK